MNMTTLKVIKTVFYQTELNDVQAKEIPNLKIKGSNPVTGTGRKKMAQKYNPDTL